MAKILLDIVTTEMKDKEARKCISERETLIKERSRNEKCKSMPLEIYLSVV